MERADYGVDAPVVVRRAVIAALVGAGLLVARRWGGLEPGPRFAGPFEGTAAALLVWGTIVALAMVFASRVVKFRIRDRVLDELALRGGERVLDVGCGRGLLLLGAARRLRSRTAVGVDLWRRVDQSGNDPTRTRANARAEGLATPPPLVTADARVLPFRDGVFDVVVSSWAIHNIPGSAGRDRAVREIARVLAPGGRVALVDIRHTARYADVLRDAGLVDVRRSGQSWIFLFPTRTLTATRR